MIPGEVLDFQKKNWGGEGEFRCLILFLSVGIIPRTRYRCQNCLMSHDDLLFFFPPSAVLAGSQKMSIYMRPAFLIPRHYGDVVICT